MISLFILSILFLGLDAANLAALHEAEALYYFNVATQQMNNLVERLSIAYPHDLPQQISLWNVQNQQTLPQGHGKLLVNNLNYQIEIKWGKNESPLCNKIGKSGCLQWIYSR